MIVGAAGLVVYGIVGWLLWPPGSFQSTEGVVVDPLGRGRRLIDHRPDVGSPLEPASAPLGV